MLLCNALLEGFFIEVDPPMLVDDVRNRMQDGCPLPEMRFVRQLLRQPIHYRLRVCRREVVDERKDPLLAQRIEHEQQVDDVGDLLGIGRSHNRTASYDQRHKLDHLVEHVSEQSAYFLPILDHQSPNYLNDSQGQFQEIKAIVLQLLYFSLQQPENEDIEPDLLLQLLPLFPDLRGLAKQLRHVEDQRLPLREEERNSRLGDHPLKLHRQLGLSQFESVVDVKGLKVVANAEVAAEPLFVIQRELRLLIVKDELRSLTVQKKASFEVPQGEILAGANQEWKLIAWRAGADDFPQTGHECYLPEEIVDFAILFGVVLRVECDLYFSGRGVLLAKRTQRLMLADSYEAVLALERGLEQNDVSIVQDMG